MPKKTWEEKIKSRLENPDIGPKRRARLEQDLKEYQSKKFGYAKKRRELDARAKYRESFGEPPKEYDESLPIHKDDMVSIIKGNYKGKIAKVLSIKKGIAYCQVLGLSEGNDSIITFSKSSIAKHHWA